MRTQIAYWNYSYLATLAQSALLTMPSYVMHTLAMPLYL